MRTLLGTTLFLLIVLLPASLFGQFPPDPAVTETPRFWPLAKFGTYQEKRMPTNDSMSEVEEKQLLQAYLQMPVTPRYLYSGCHDRAHAVYLMLPSNLRPKIMKIWVIAPAKYTEAIIGTITSVRPEPEYTAVNWGYHVALAYRTAMGERKIIDPALLPGQVVSQDVWFGEMKTPTLSLWTLTDGSVYLFNNNAVRRGNENNDLPDDFKDPWAVNSRVWNGNSYSCDKDCTINAWTANALARDAIGVDATASKTCQALQEKATIPDDLLTELQTGKRVDKDHKPAGDLPAQCKPSLDKFAAQKSIWATNLAPHP